MRFQAAPLHGRVGRLATAGGGVAHPLRPRASIPPTCTAPFGGHASCSVTNVTAHPADAECLPVRHLDLVETSHLTITPDQRVAMNAVWDAATRENPNLFDGPVVVCTAVEQHPPAALRISWARATYRIHALRRVPGATSWHPSLFVTALQPTPEGSLLVGQMSSSTAAPRRWQLPGGSVEPPPDHEILDLDWLQRQASRELEEETGVEVQPAELGLWTVTRGHDGNIGVHFLAPPKSATFLHDRYSLLMSSEKAAGRTPEFDRIALAWSTADLRHLDGQKADYLGPVIRGFSEGR